jgi:hypothetical protein
VRPPLQAKLERDSVPDVRPVATGGYAMKASLMRVCLALVLLGGLAACGDTWRGMKQDTGENMESAGETMEDAGETVKP